MTIDPQAQAVLDLIRQVGAPSYETLPAAVARELYRGGRARLSPDPPEVALSRDLVAAGRGGGIPVRLYRPLGAAAETALPVLVFYHGGGWVIGDRDTHDVVCRGLANASGAAVVSVDYRLAPEHQFPAAVEDAWDALAWVRAQSAGLCLDPDRVAVGGDSAGGNLAAVVALLARDAGVRLRYQLLIYPATDFAELLPSQLRLAEGYLLTRANQEWFRDQYLRDVADRSDWRASPLRAATLRNLPPAFVVTAGYDPLADEGQAYADRLAAEGVSVVKRHFPGQIHGFLTMGRMIEASGIAIAEMGPALKAAFAA